MTVMEYVAKFTELACFTDDYVATDIAKVRRFKDGLKLSICGKLWVTACKTWTRWLRWLWPLSERG